MECCVKENSLKNRQKIAIKCRICYALDDPMSNICDLISPCKCKGSMKYVHRSCLKIWRYKSKRFSEIKKCEYCLTFYTIEDEVMPHKLITRSIAAVFLTGIFIFLHYAFNFLLKMICIFKNGFDYQELQENILFKFIPIEVINDRFIETFYCLQLTLNGTAVVISIVYQIVKKNNMFHSFNYMFTLWRIIYFNFYIDSLYFLL
ncbi:hypothetical protein H311_00381, partial [Anncaliia algerae PRA109]